MKEVLFLVCIIVSIFSSSAYGFEPNQFGYTVFPQKIVENTEGLIQVNMLENGIPVPIQIKDLKVTSSDSDVIEILEIIYNENSFFNSIKIKAKSHGEANIALAAPGFLSEEFPILVYATMNSPQQLLVKSVPDSFSPVGPDKGYFSIELADAEGFPVKASVNTLISLSTSNNQVLEFFEKELIIKKGEYFVSTDFQIIGTGEVTVYAHTKDMTVKSSLIKVGEEDDYTITLYSIPGTINANQNSKGYIIAQLQDESGEPVIARKNITVNYKIVGSEFQASVNSSDEFKDLRASGFFEIKEGSYWGYASYTVLAGIEDIYEITISTEKPLAIDSDLVEVKVLELYDDKLIRFETLPILATGNQELVGILYMEDEDGEPVIAEKDLYIEINSSDEKFLSIDNVKISRGDHSVLVFGNVAHVVSDDLELYADVDDSEIIMPEIFGPKKGSTTLQVEPLIPKILTGTNFPIAIFLEEDNKITQFSTYSELFISPSVYNNIETKRIVPGDSLIILNSESIKEGSDTLDFEVGDFKTAIEIENLSSSPASVELNYQEPILSNSKNTFSLQILDVLGQPVFAEEAIEFNLILDNQFLKVPDVISIEKGDYYTLFDVEPKISTKSELSILASDFPLSTFSINSDSIEPEIHLSAPNEIKSKSAFDLSLNAKMADLPLEGIEVDWDVNGAEIQTLTSITDRNGNAKLTLIPKDSNRIIIQATVLGLGFADTKIVKEIIVKTNVDDEGKVSIIENKNDLDNGNNIIFILIPIVLILGFIIKKKNLLQNFTEKIPFFDKAANLPIVEKLTGIIQDLNQRIDLEGVFTSIKEKIPVIKDR